MTTIPEPVIQALEKVDTFMAKYPTVTQYGKVIHALMDV